MILLDDVTLTYPDGEARVTAVDHVTLEGRPGVLTGITGPSGSGKSSLLALAATLVRPDSGRVVIDGVDASGLDAAARTTLRRERIGIVFQQPQLLPALTAREQLCVMAELEGRGRRARRATVRARVDELLDAVGLAAQADRRPAGLSGGQRQRVAIARALVHEPRVLLVDEPTSALDSARGAEIMALLSRLARERRTATLLVTHDVAHADALDETVNVVDGRATSLTSRSC
ncbi:MULTISPECIES: ABC transporter ATP-binding protein [Microbacterium]|uniref:ABC transporter ATP-binding protein n=1 Tax=Microbacterium TaxID=33882 RepID=UPI00277D9471|nr:MULTISPECIES: ABC transporter ATP-binding protein [Microbacterium]MDQ1084887.1 putative ABC transport system ATP-binding protein [Microbacterium sp. SORGH_AS_0344]MDQ1169835.1 putative ABC transport system ATP-binding protein [Microbacterium proteolyticum]